MGQPLGVTAPYTLSEGLRSPSSGLVGLAEWGPGRGCLPAALGANWNGQKPVLMPSQASQGLADLKRSPIYSSLDLHRKSGTVRLAHYPMLWKAMKPFQSGHGQDWWPLSVYTAMKTNGSGEGDGSMGTSCGVCTAVPVVVLCMVSWLRNLLCLSLCHLEPWPSL